MEAETQEQVYGAINKLLGKKELFSADVLAGVALPERGVELKDKGLGKLSKAELESFNRLVLEAVYPEHIKLHVWETSRRKAANITAVTGNANLAMLAATAVALYVLWRQRKPSRSELSKIVETSLMSGGVIILITSGGGAFGAMLKAAEIDIAIKGIFAGGGGGQLGGVSVLLLGFFIAFLLKFAQGSSTVSMITTSSMMVGFVASPEALGFHPVYLATAIGFGSQCGNWMNDSGFWIFAKMSGLTEVETLKTWTVTVSTLAFVGLGFSLLFAKVLPLI
jgi:H+/gluconate symporter-like permease